MESDVFKAQLLTAADIARKELDGTILLSLTEKGLVRYLELKWPADKPVYDGSVAQHIFRSLVPGVQHRHHVSATLFVAISLRAVLRAVLVFLLFTSSLTCYSLFEYCRCHHCASAHHQLSTLTAKSCTTVDAPLGVVCDT